MELFASVKEYDWGKIGKKSKVAILAKGNNPELKIDGNTPYAELWIGTHPSGDAIIKENNETLKKYLETHSSSLGAPIIDNFGPSLPFLLKVLSIRKPLSIQAHPDKALAKTLHSKYPEIYKDDNHKPEMIVALTEFEALCGFRPLHEIKYFISNMPDLESILGSSCQPLMNSTEDNMDPLKMAFEKLIKSDPSTIIKFSNKLIQFFIHAKSDERDKYLGDLFLKLQQHFPYDIGNFTIYFLNHIILKPGEAIFLAPNEPHAYLSGDGVECMGSSDNVIRAAFTPKYIDSETLIQMLTYKCEDASKKKVTPVQVDSYTYEYRVNFPEFKIAKIEISSPLNSYTLKKRESGCLLLIIEGEAKLNEKNISPGTIYFFEANASITVTDILTKNLLIFQAYCEV